MSRSHFEESQKFSQWWRWLFLMLGLLTTVGVSVSGVYIQLIEGRPFGNKPMSDTGIVIFSLLSVVFSVGMILFMKSFHLETKVDHLGFSYRFFPLLRQWKTLYREDILAWKITRKTCAHHGIRTGLRSKSLRVAGNTVLELKLSSGKKLLVGTQKPDEISLAMQKFFDRQPND